MTNRQTPPGRKSKLEVVVVKPIGPHHCARCLRSVHAENTRSRGASNARMPTKDRASRSRSILLAAVIAGVLLRLLGKLQRLGRFGLKRFQIVVEAIETLVKKAP